MMMMMMVMDDDGDGYMMTMMMMTGQGALSCREEKWDTGLTTRVGKKGGF